MIELNVDVLMEAAKAQTGLDDFGDEEFIEPFNKLVNELHREAELNQMGEMTLAQLYLQLLTNRLRFSSDLKESPEILEQELAPPLIVLGLPRSGTTKLHRVLAAHPDTQSLPLWKVMNPSPLPGSEKSAEDPRIGMTQAMLQAVAENFPDTLAGHPMDATEPDEETQYLMEMTFDGPLIPVRAHLPSFSAWRWNRSMLPCYRYFHSLLQYLQWQFDKKGSAKKPYVLKSPLHMGHIDELLDIFPDATIVHCHRDPVDSVASFAKLVEAGWAMVSDMTDMKKFGEASMDLLGEHMDRYLEKRPALEARTHFIDVDFRDIVDDAVKVATTCFEQHGLEMDENIEKSIRDWERENPATKHGKHTYTLDSYGLTENQVRKRFSAYYNAFPGLSGM